MDDELIGRRFGILTVVSEAEPRKNSRGYPVRYYSCLCDCGNIKETTKGSLLGGHVNSCGCRVFPKKSPVDLTGQQFGDLTVLSEAEPRRQRSGKVLRMWNCRCVCGNEKPILQANLTKPHGVRSCGCKSNHIGRPTAGQNLLGNRYGRLTIIEEAEPITRKGGLRRRRYRCRCDCGNETVVAVDNLLSGHTRSCGCFKSNGLKGKKMGMLTVLSRAKVHSAQAYWNCRCDCGNELIVSFDDLFWGTVTSCGCDSKEKSDLTGQKFGRLTALREVAPVPKSGGGNIRCWLCRCRCGREVVVRHDNLVRKVTRSCGCLKADKARQRR